MGVVLDFLTASTFASCIPNTQLPAYGDQVRTTSRNRNRNLDTDNSLAISFSFHGKEKWCATRHPPCFQSSTNTTGAHNSAWRNGSPPSHPKTRPKSSRMSHSLFCLDGHACVISLNTKVLSPILPTPILGTDFS